MRDLQQAVWGRVLRRRAAQAAAGALALGLLLGPSAARAQGDGSSAAAQAETGAEVAAADCGSVVIRNCRVRPRGASVVIDTNQPVLRAAPPQWEAVHAAGPDSEEIVVTGERPREPTPSEVFDRYLGAPVGSMGALVSRQAAGGARCTTISRSGGTLCSVPGGAMPWMGTPVTSWSFSF